MNRRAVFYLLLVFLLGAAVGGLGAYLGNKWNVFDWHRGGPDRARGAVESLTRELGLSPDQQARLQTILAETGQKYRETWERSRRENEEIRQTARQRIREILTEEQKPRFEELLRQIDTRRRERPGRTRSNRESKERR
jgi:hypothetical protein